MLLLLLYISSIKGKIGIHTYMYINISKNCTEIVISKIVIVLLEVFLLYSLFINTFVNVNGSFVYI